ncbi:MAG: carbohydrate ABC transporter permease [Actinomycetota bacterium]
MTSVTPTVDQPRAKETPGKTRSAGRGRPLLYITLIAIAVLYISPFLINISTSFKSDAEAANNPLGLIPQTWTLGAYEQLFQQSDFPSWVTNSVIVTVTVTIGRVFLDSLAGYALARLRFRGRTLIFAGLIAVMSVPNVVLLIPRFVIINELGIFDTYAALIIPLLVDAIGIFIMKNFFESIPVSVEEQARVDGAGVFRTFWSIVLPMAVPAVMAVGILSFQGSWNELSHFIVASQDPELTTLGKGIAELASGELGEGSKYPLKLAAGALMTLPVAVMFFVFQRRIVNSTTGAIKE